MSSPQEIIASQEAKIKRLTEQNGQLLSKVRKQVRVIEELKVANRELRKYLDPSFEMDPNRPKISTKESKGYAPPVAKKKPAKKNAAPVAAESKSAAPSDQKKKPVETTSPPPTTKQSTESSSSEEDQQIPKHASIAGGRNPVPPMMTPQHFDMMKEIRLKMQKKAEARQQATSEDGTTTEKDTSTNSTPTTLSPAAAKSKYENMPKPPPPVSFQNNPSRESVQLKASDNSDLRKHTALNFNKKQEPTSEQDVNKDTAAEAVTPGNDPSEKVSNEEKQAEDVSSSNDDTSITISSAEDIPAKEANNPEEESPPAQKPTGDNKPPPPLPTKPKLDIKRLSANLSSEESEGSESAPETNPVLAALQKRNRKKVGDL